MLNQITGIRRIVVGTAPARAARVSFADELRGRTFRYALRIIAACRHLPDTWEAREVGRQLLRAGTGVTGNYHSACRGRSHREFVAKLGVAADEADESVLWLALLTRSGIGDQRELQELLAEGRELVAILSRSCKTARENRQHLS